ncbi:TVP38/TMEM64 family protein [Jiella pelagia]|uniref:TVP38/TMEM64 family membrane protein n=1 Tax=Jiella pelagia TaxID=2986949 RepID=A0ABY7C658_9HYPH|nr:TVP38/TMEM64 family protein [Jiella pelagia]WAP71424.1 TVP38/TMEM64 family protein [Jiella pelagia]
MQDRRHVGGIRSAEADIQPRNSGRPSGQSLTARIAIGIAVLLAMVGLYWGLSESGLMSAIESREDLRREIERLGVWGPLAIIGLMAAAIVMSPIPSGPIALVAGAAYGPLWGTAYVAIGAETGALIAFTIARHLGYEWLRRWPSAQALFDRLGQDRSQNRLMAIVFASRLVPFISFDAVSYVAGLTPLSFWRFAIATVTGIVPLSFAFAYFGEQAFSANSERLMLLLLLAGGITLLPMAVKLMRNHMRKGR